MINYKRKYLYYGVAFGFVFPVFAIIAILFFSNSVWVLFLVICTAPLFLGLFAMRIGVVQNQLRKNNIELEKTVDERTGKIMNMLDVSGQGFLSFGSDFMVKEHYSRKCEDIFGVIPAGRKFPELLFDDRGLQEEFITGIELFFRKQASSKVVFNFMEKTIRIGNRIISAEYKIINEDEILCILSDLTLQRILEDKQKIELHDKNIIFRMISNQQFFSSFVRETDKFLQSLSQSMKMNSTDVESLQRHLHTLKGNASILAFEETRGRAEDFEDFLSEQSVGGETADIREQAEKLIKSYRAELNVIENGLGEDWLDRIDHISISSSQLVNLEHRIGDEWGKNHEIYKKIRNLRKVPISKMFSPFPQMVRRIASSLGKKIGPMEISGDEIPVVPEDYEKLVNTFVHIIRNMLDHGIETPAERRKKNKPEEGKISIDVKRNEMGMIMSFEDDGRGLDWEKIDQQGRTMGLLSMDGKQKENEIKNLIFLKGFTTAKGITEYSGRGVGLWAVKTEVDKLDGCIDIHTDRNQGTSFHITLPLVN